MKTRTTHDKRGSARVRVFAAALGLACATMGTTSCVSPLSQRPLTAEQVAERTVPSHPPRKPDYTVVIEGLDFPAQKIAGTRLATMRPGPVQLRIPATSSRGVVEVGREFRFPCEFDPPRKLEGKGASIVPTTPLTFETKRIGWSVQLSVRQAGKLLSVSGAAEYVEAETLPAGYGEVAGPIHDERGRTLSENQLLQPRFQTTTTRFHIFATPGKAYDVTLYRGAKAVKSRITIHFP